MAAWRGTSDWKSKVISLYVPRLSAPVPVCRFVRLAPMLPLKLHAGSSVVTVYIPPESTATVSPLAPPIEIALAMGMDATTRRYEKTRARTTLDPQGRQRFVNLCKPLADLQ